jgi:hypothetical protein
MHTMLADPDRFARDGASEVLHELGMTGAATF